MCNSIRVIKKTNVVLLDLNANDRAVFFVLVVDALGEGAQVHNLVQVLSVST